MPLQQSENERLTSDFAPVAASILERMLSGVESAPEMFDFVTLHGKDPAPSFVALRSECEAERRLIPVCVRAGESRLVTVGRAVSYLITGPYVRVSIQFTVEERGAAAKERFLAVAREGRYRLEVGIVRGQVTRLELVEQRPEVVGKTEASAPDVAMPSTAPPPGYIPGNPKYPGRSHTVEEMTAVEKEDLKDALLY